MSSSQGSPHKNTRLRQIIKSRIGKKSGLLAESYIRLGKQATIEKRYIVKQLGTLPASEINSLKTMLRKMLRL